VDELREHIKKLREDFSRGTLDESEVEKDPSLQFKKWMQHAVEAQIIELQAMTLSTVSAGGKPSSRIVYLREFGDHNYTFYSNYESRKGQELMDNPNAALTFFWPHLERQIRIEGVVTRAPEEQSNNYFMNRPYESQVGAWASNQSGKLQSRQELETRISSLKNDMPPEKMKRPPFWGGFTLAANYYEFWQGRKSRLHDRICYTVNEKEWKISRIAP
jgi:pyridoxamine 5'-phosphate oxidase